MLTLEPSNCYLAGVSVCDTLVTTGVALTHSCHLLSIFYSVSTDIHYVVEMV